MFRAIYIITLLLLSTLAVSAQSSKVRLTDSTTVKDSGGTVFALEQWKDMIASGRYMLRAEDPDKENSDFFLIRMSEDEFNRRTEALPKPAETKNFFTGKSIYNFSARDINGNRIQLKSLQGKVVVLNFWFIACTPCQREIPELNELVKDYKDSADVVFLAVAPDDKKSIQDFLLKKPFDYDIIDDGSFIARQYGIFNYPTHVVLDRNGKVVFHTAGYGATTVRWLRRSVAKAMQL